MKKFLLVAFAGVAIVAGIAAFAFLVGGTATPPVAAPVATATQPVTPMGITIHPNWVAEVVNLSFLNKNAESVVIGRVVEILPPKWDIPDGRQPALLPWSDTLIYTDAIVQVDRVVKGSVPSRIVVRTIGGAIGIYSVVVEGETNLEAGQKVLLFLTKEGQLDNKAGDDGAYWVVGSQHGKFTVTDDNFAVRHNVDEQYQKLPLQEVLDSAK